MAGIVLSKFFKIFKASAAAISSGVIASGDEVVSNRVKTYHDKTEPLIEYYKAAGLYREIDGVDTIEEVRSRIFAAMEK